MTGKRITREAFALAAKAKEGPNPFLSERYSSRGEHLAKMKQHEFVRTEADDTFESVTRGRDNLKRDTIHMEYGDPASYPGLDANEFIPRYIRRYVNFEPPCAYSRYEFYGDPAIIGQVRMGSSRRETGYIPVPQHVDVYPTAGVAGALRLIADSLFLPSQGASEFDNVVVPTWTYLSHMAEVVRMRASVRSCRLNREGQVDLDHMSELIDHNTRAVILATVGNPMSTAMEHGRFDELLRLVYDKMYEYEHAIPVVADVIYEHFRRKENGQRLDAIQKSLQLGRLEGVDVPMIETSSFSKMFAMAGQRFGFFRAMLSNKSSIEAADFAKDRLDMREAFKINYGTTLCPVPSLIQKAVGRLYYYVNQRLPVEEELAPLAAVLCSLDQLTRMKGKGDTNTMVNPSIANSVIRKLDFDPDIWFTTSAIAKRTRKLANDELRAYGVDIVTDQVERIGERLERAGLIDVENVTIEVEAMKGILMRSVNEQMTDGEIEDNARDMGLDITVAQVRELLDRIAGSKIAGKETRDLEERVCEELGIDREDLDKKGRKMTLTFYRLRKGMQVPTRPINDGQLSLYRIAEDERWKDVARLCDIQTEDQRYQLFKHTRREEVFRRVDAFLKGLEQMRQEGLGIYLHPSYYDEEGNLAPERINAFYILFGFERLREKNVRCQSSELIGLCVANETRIVKTTPGDVFLPPDVKGQEDSYIRAVALLPVPFEEGHGGECDRVASDTMVEDALHSIRVAAQSLMPSTEDELRRNQMRLPFL